MNSVYSDLRVHYHIPIQDYPKYRVWGRVHRGMWIRVRSRVGKQFMLDLRGISFSGKWKESLGRSGL